MYRTHRQRLITIVFTHTHCILIMQEVARLSPISSLSCEQLALAGPSLATQATTGFHFHWLCSPPLALQSSTGLHWLCSPPLATQASTGHHQPRRSPLASRASTGTAGNPRPSRYLHFSSAHGRCTTGVLLVDVGARSPLAACTSK